MVSKRVLPERGNPLVDPEHTPDIEQLIERRRLGRTNLNAPKIGSTGPVKEAFDYAHLRVPLPKDLKGSGIFALGKQATYPESYFLMRRSSDGYVSATGMFKAAFPWATSAEEETERRHHKSLLEEGAEEVAGNVWIHPKQAISLAEEYNLHQWVIALVDPEPIESGQNHKSPEKDIATPPKFIFSKEVLLPPPSTNTRGSTRKRSTRSASPSKIATPSRKIASPRKRTVRKKKNADDSDAASVASSALQNVLENGTTVSVADSVAAPSPSIDGVLNGTASETVKVKVDEVVTKDGDEEVTQTSVVVEMPIDRPDLPLPDNAEDMVAKAKEMVEAARANDAKAAEANGIKPSRKRKAAEVAADDELAEASGAAFPSAEDAAEPAAKKTKVTETQKKQSVRTRAMFGVGLTLALGAAIPYFL